MRSVPVAVQQMEKFYNDLFIIYAHSEIVQTAAEGPQIARQEHGVFCRLKAE